jgi:hypothetical protein
MDDSAEVRDAAREALGDIEPERLRGELLDRIDDAWLVPGTLTVLAARRAGASGLSTGLRSRAVGVQLIYEGLALTRQLVHDEPWTDGDPEAADLAVLVADVLVARGAYLLARTEAADRAVEIIRDFGRDQTGRPRGDTGHALESEVFDLAAVAGSTAVHPEPSAALIEWADDLADSLGDGDHPDVSTLVARVEPTGSGGQRAVANEGRTGSSDP